MLMDYMLAAAAAALTNIGLLGAVIFTYVQNLRLIKTYFTIGLVLVGSLFIIQNIVIVIFWFNLYLAGPSIKNIVGAAAPYLTWHKHVVLPSCYGLQEDKSIKKDFIYGYGHYC
jgi:hypothetical protein